MDQGVSTIKRQIHTFCLFTVLTLFLSIYPSELDANSTGEFDLDLVVILSKKLKKIFIQFVYCLGFFFLLI